MQQAQAGSPGRRRSRAAWAHLERLEDAHALHWVHQQLVELVGPQGHLSQHRERAAWRGGRSLSTKQERWQQPPRGRRSCASPARLLLLLTRQVMLSAVLSTSTWAEVGKHPPEAAGRGLLDGDVHVPRGLREGGHRYVLLQDTASRLWGEASHQHLLQASAGTVTSMRAKPSSEDRSVAEGRRQLAALADESKRRHLGCRQTHWLCRDSPDGAQHPQPGSQQQQPSSCWTDIS